jgi:rod shape-determining protein MreC
MLFFVRRNQILLSSLLCVLFSLYLLFATTRGYLKSDPVGPLLIELIRPFQIGVQKAVVWVRDIREGLSTWRGLAAQNDDLRDRLQELEAERNRLLEAEATNDRLRELLELRSQLPSRSTSATVIATSASTWFRSLILNKGKSHGVRKGMAVVSPTGVVGQVVAVTPWSSKVLLVTDPSSGVDVLVQRTRSRGIVSGSLDDGPIMKYVQRSEDIQEGDRLVTSGLGGVFPKGLFVGTVDEVRKTSFGMFQHVGVSLAEDLSKIEEVLVVSSATSKPKN